ncbi:MAG: hypothetical protein HYR51_15885, partial [Candidatus Rokubacteria bacterium]|nr:hypothetical protein [Candidatus Rokubacteria bacterium]
MRKALAVPTILAVLVVLALLVSGGQPPRVATAQAPTVLKIQASWPASLTIYDHF